MRDVCEQIRVRNVRYFSAEGCKRPGQTRCPSWDGDVSDTSLGVIFDKAIPDFTKDHLSPAVADVLSSLGKDADEIDRFVFHPGGTKVIQAIEQSLELAPESLSIERQVLRDFGNMSAPTVLFVLKRVLEAGQNGNMLMGAFGPGFSASFMPIARA